jgi:hypothetical protein
MSGLRYGPPEREPDNDNEDVGFGCRLRCHCARCKHPQCIDALKAHGGQLVRQLDQTYEVVVPEDRELACPQCGGKRFFFQFILPRF